MILVDVHELLAFYDEESGARPHSNAIKTLAGEELGIALLIDYFRKCNAKAELLRQPCTTGKQKGPRLDGWLKVNDQENEIYYQVEVKAWSFHGFGGGRPLKVHCTAQELSEAKRSAWAEYWVDDRFRYPALSKVLTPMTCPVRHANVEPLACLWAAMHPNGEGDPLFSVLLNSSTTFRRLWVFSMSAFLRSLNQPTLCLYLPKTQERLRWLERLFRIEGA